MSVTTADLVAILGFLSDVIYQFFTALDSVYLGDYSYLDYMLAFSYVFITYNFIQAAFGRRSDNGNDA